MNSPLVDVLTFVLIGSAEVIVAIVGFRKEWLVRSETHRNFLIAQGVMIIFFGLSKFQEGEDSLALYLAFSFLVVSLLILIKGYWNGEL